MRKYQLSSGKVLEFSLAGTEVALELFRKVLNECKNAGLDFNFTEETRIIDAIASNKEALLNIFSSKSVMDAVCECCSKVLYDKKHFSMELFEEEKARADFFSVMVIVGVENLTPFFPQVHSYLEPILSLFLKA